MKLPLFLRSDESLRQEAELFLRRAKPSHEELALISAAVEQIADAELRAEGRRWVAELRAEVAS